MTIVAADIGGTHTRVARVTTDGTIVARRDTLTRPERGAAAAIAEMSVFIDELLAESATPLTGLGLAVTGPVDTASGILDNPYTLGGWGPTDLITPFQERFGVRPQIENDANSAALGEWVYGAGRGSRRLAMITIGTGIGVGLIADGKIQRRSDGAHGEAGHHLLDPNGPRCYCGARGCWEVLAAGPALVRLAIGEVSGTAEPSRSASERDRQAADSVLTAAAVGDPAALEILAELAGWIGRGLVNSIAFFMPDTIVIGGGIGARCISLLRPSVAAVLAQHSRLVPTDVSLLAATAGDDAGLLGAAAAAGTGLDRTGPRSWTRPARSSP